MISLANKEICEVFIDFTLLYTVVCDIIRYVCKSNEKPRRHTICFNCGRLSRQRQGETQDHQIFGKAEGSGSRKSELSHGTQGGRQGRKVSTGTRNPFTDPRSEEKDLEPSPELWMVASR